MSHFMYELSIILPSYNEAHRLASSLTAIKQAVQAATDSYEIIIVDDGSSDNTVSVARLLTQENIIFITYVANQGKGYAVRQGMQRARGKYHLFMDVDLATSLDALATFYQLMKNNEVDVLIGDRKSNPDNQKIRQPLARRLLGTGFTFLSQILLHCPLHDFTCGFKMFTQEASEIIFKRQRINRWSFDSEILFIAQKHHCVIKEIPVTWQHQPNSKVRLSADIPSSLKGLVQIRINDMRELYQ